jgi:hypothetical protein
VRNFSRGNLPLDPRMNLKVVFSFFDPSEAAPTPTRAVLPPKRLNTEHIPNKYYFSSFRLGPQFARRGGSLRALGCGPSQICHLLHAIKKFPRRGERLRLNMRTVLASISPHFHAKNRGF